MVTYSQKKQITTYYVNDNSKIGDVFTNNVGKDDNDGLSVQKPIATVAVAYKKAKEGDYIYIDTGRYNDLNNNGEVTFPNVKKVEFVLAKKNDSLFFKKPLPKDIKASPTEFYILNDKPVDKEVYMKSLQK
jgi:hypothetical protein